MAWILMLLAVACFLVPFFTTSTHIVLSVVCMLLALVFMVVATMMLLSARVGGATRNAPMLTADELRVMRELAERQRNDAAAPANPDGSSMPQKLNAASDADPSPPSPAP